MPNPPFNSILNQYGPDLTPTSCCPKTRLHVTCHTPISSIFQLPSDPDVSPSYSLRVSSCHTSDLYVCVVDFTTLTVLAANRLNACEDLLKIRRLSHRRLPQHKILRQCHSRPSLIPYRPMLCLNLCTRLFLCLSSDRFVRGVPTKILFFFPHVDLIRLTVVGEMVWIWLIMYSYTQTRQRKIAVFCSSSSSYSSKHYIPLCTLASNTVFLHSFWSLTAVPHYLQIPSTTSVHLLFVPSILAVTFFVFFRYSSFQYVHTVLI
jgi:hypothetical protein